MYGCPHRLHMGSMITASHICGVCDGTGRNEIYSGSLDKCGECQGAGVITQSTTLIELAMAMRDALTILATSDKSYEELAGGRVPVVLGGWTD